MIAPAEPLFQWGQKVSAVDDLRNDGSFPELAPDALIVRAGAVGEIVQVGMHVEANLPVYMVEFGPNRVVGCLEGEIALEVRS